MAIKDEKDWRQTYHIWQGWMTMNDKVVTGRVRWRLFKMCLYFVHTVRKCSSVSILLWLWSGHYLVRKAEKRRRKGFAGPDGPPLRLCIVRLCPLIVSFVLCLVKVVLNFLSVTVYRYYSLPWCTFWGQIALHFLLLHYLSFPVSHIQ